MFGFGWVRTDLGDFFSGQYKSFLLILVGFLEKETNQQKWEISGFYTVA